MQVNFAVLSGEAVGKNIILVTEIFVYEM